MPIVFGFVVHKQVTFFVSKSHTRKTADHLSDGHESILLFIFFFFLKERPLKTLDNLRRIHLGQRMVKVFNKTKWSGFGKSGPTCWHESGCEPSKNLQMFSSQESLLAGRDLHFFWATYNLEGIALKSESNWLACWNWMSCKMVLKRSAGFAMYYETNWLIPAERKHGTHLQQLLKC